MGEERRDTGRTSTWTPRAECVRRARGEGVRGGLTARRDATRTRPRQQARRRPLRSALILYELQIALGPPLGLGGERRPRLEEPMERTRQPATRSQQGRNTYPVMVHLQATALTAAARPRELGSSGRTSERDRRDPGGETQVRHRDTRPPQARNAELTCSLSQHSLTNSEHSPANPRRSAVPRCLLRPRVPTALAHHAPRSCVCSGCRPPPSTPLTASSGRVEWLESRRDFLALENVDRPGSDVATLAREKCMSRQRRVDSGRNSSSLRLLASDGCGPARERRRDRLEKIASHWRLSCDCRVEQVSSRQAECVANSYIPCVW